MRKLSKAGIGRRAVHMATDVAISVLSKIRAGVRTRVRARTARLILAVTPVAACDRALTPARHTWRLIDELLEEGYTVPFLAKRLGYVRPTLQLKRSRVTVRNAARVARLHRELTS